MYKKLFNRVVPLVDVEDVLDNYVDELKCELMEGEVYEQDEDHIIIQEPYYGIIPELNAKLLFIIYCNRAEDEDGEPLTLDGEPIYEADFSGWIFLHAETGDWLYEEGYSTLSAAVSNGFGKNINDLTCELYVLEEIPA